MILQVSVTCYSKVSSIETKELISLLSEKTRSIYKAGVLNKDRPPGEKWDAKPLLNTSCLPIIF